MNYYTDVLKKYAVFTGRARRKEFWMFTLWNGVISLVLSIVIGIISGAVNSSSVSQILSFIPGLYGLAVLIPSIAVLIRRLHDIDRSGFWIFINLIPLIGQIVLLVFLVKDSQPGDNKYGPNPKGMGAPQVAVVPPATS